MCQQMRLLGWFFTVLIALHVGMASAETPAESYVRSQHSELVSLLSQPKSAARDQKVNAVMDRVFDYEDLARRSLGDDWAPRTESEREEFKGLLEQLIRQSYRKHLDKTNGWDITYNAATSVNGGVTVPTVAKHKTDKRKEPVGIDYLLHEVKGQWRVFDIVIEGSSLVGNYRSQFPKDHSEKWIWRAHYKNEASCCQGFRLSRKAVGAARLAS